MYAWCKKKSVVPSDGDKFEDEPFVLDYELLTQGASNLGSTIKITMSTKRLLSQVKRRKHLCVDSTHNLLFLGKNLYLRDVASITIL